MVGPSSPLFLPLAHAAVTSSPRLHDERHRSQNLNPQHLHPDACLPTLSSNSGSPNLATDFRVGSPTDFTSPTALGASAYTGSDGDDIEMCEADNSHHQSDGINLSAKVSAKVSANLQSKKITELDRYLDEDPVPRSQEFDILKWWMGNASKYPVLARIARDLLAIPASSVASESAFSTSERIISDSRSSLTPEIVEALVCTQDWYRAEGSSEFSMSSISDLIMCEDNTRL